MKNANGTGGIVNLGKRRRKPYAVRVTDGWQDGKQIYRYVGYYATRKEAQKALAEEQVNPSFPKSEITFKDLHNEWSKVHFKKISKQTEDNYKAAYASLSSLHEMKFKNIRTGNLQAAIDRMKQGRASKEKAKLLCTSLYKYALENDIVNKNYAQFIKLEKSVKKEKEIFTDTEIQKLFDNDSIPYVDVILILIYTGFRIQELFDLTKFNIDLKNWTITGGLKTDADKNRVIPVHPKIRKYIQSRYNNATGERLFPYDQSNFRKRNWYPTLEALGIARHTPHCTRHTCATLLVRSGADPIAVEKILGHTDYSFTVDTYTHVDVDFLTDQISKI